MSILIEVDKLTKSFGPFIAVDNISFSLKRGEVLGFLGPNGAGKTTTMRMITGFLSPTEGTIKVCNNDVAKYPLQVKEKIGYVPEGAPLYGEMTVINFLKFIADVRKIPSSKLDMAIENAVKKLGLELVLYQPLETLSKGYKRRVGLSQAIIHDPDILILLEPTEDGLGIQDAILRTDGSGGEFLHMKAGGSAKPASHATVDAREHFVFQDGQPVFKAAVKSMADVSEEIMQRNNLAAEDVAWLVPHQANKRIIDATARRMGVGNEKVMLNIEKYGNTTNGTIPLCLWEWESQLNKGDNIILAAFGGGFTWGSIFIKWAYDSKK